MVYLFNDCSLKQVDGKTAFTVSGWLNEVYHVPSGCSCYFKMQTGVDFKYVIEKMY